MRSKIAAIFKYTSDLVMFLFIWWSHKNIIKLLALLETRTGTSNLKQLANSTIKDYHLGKLNWTDFMKLIHSTHTSPLLGKSYEFIATCARSIFKCTFPPQFLAHGSYYGANHLIMLWIIKTIYIAGLKWMNIMPIKETTYNEAKPLTHRALPTL